jgi:hypothetical protein
MKALARKKRAAVTSIATRQKCEVDRMICLYCDEPILQGEHFGSVNGGRDRVHDECLIRMTLGSAAHQLGECLCCGGTRGDPPGATRRQAARLAKETFNLLRGETPLKLGSSIE